MSLPLLDSIVYGPVKSRCLGSSLGINLLPAHLKVSPDTASRRSTRTSKRSSIACAGKNVGNTRVFPTKVLRADFMERLSALRGERLAAVADGLRLVFDL